MTTYLLQVPDGYSLNITTQGGVGSGSISIGSDGYTNFTTQTGALTIGSSLGGASTTINTPIILTNQTTTSAGSTFSTYLEITVNSISFKIPLYI